ncbi:MAG: hypothetical protein ABIH89_07965 [Elusimicrobiota bacterium]
MNKKALTLVFLLCLVVYNGFCDTLDWVAAGGAGIDDSANTALHPGGIFNGSLLIGPENSSSGGAIYGYDGTDFTSAMR